jgi:Mn-dependent DtxR family transcriptional regulator
MGEYLDIIKEEISSGGGYPGTTADGGSVSMDVEGGTSTNNIAVLKKVLGQLRHRKRNGYKLTKKEIEEYRRLERMSELQEK